MDVFLLAFLIKSKFNPVVVDFWNQLIKQMAWMENQKNRINQNRKLCNWKRKDDRNENAGILKGAQFFVRFEQL